MGKISFIKAVALGNDFMILDGRSMPLSLTSAQIKKLADRREGVGFDQLVLLQPPTDPLADVQLVFYNADGSQAAACGNGTRAVARFLMEKQEANSLCLQTASALCRASRLNGKDELSVTMGEPRFGWGDIPLSHPGALNEVSYQGLVPFCVNVGNPHAVFFVDSLKDVPLNQIGPQIETHPAFPSRVNVGFAQVVDSQTLRLRVWERGAGATKACGTGACAAGVLAIHHTLVRSSPQEPLRIIQDGGESRFHWEEGQDMLLTGFAQITFQGQLCL